MLKKRNQKGFTLIEIIAVLVILGILAAIAVPKFFAMQDEARIKNAQAAVGTAQSAISLGYAANLMGNSTAPSSPAEACANVKLDGAGKVYTVSCVGASWAAGAAITANYDGQTATGNWNAP